MSNVKTPISFSNVLQAKVLEIQQAMIRAVKEEKYEEALEHARTVLMLEPNQPDMLNYVQILEDKIALDESDSDDSGIDSSDGDTESAGESGSDDSESESSDSDSNDEDTEIPVTIPARSLDDRQAAAMVPIFTPLQRIKRSKMKANLAKQVMRLKVIEAQEKAKAAKKDLEGNRPFKA
mmetsp:Transcript_1211/g.1780  ORF Transcript_1211/g.1780 Transcript_1211/m.1780 type:complete len:179 (-) Transcript_1211:369-905(-)|eukprot:CAMPEP_0175057780 /NCGR_PEP_ID=MMETSP0052_2-20121109/11458_1 /TAXON_ID=51329 ORGANISM="Polytomella parva, Strain SAG 63-3" /NCGR_SAMPLE_ID=MMETSP0052_2 /ASSEMBLY_ACC=CAM_ASM_000194 /LENGTH=178 /DNA_ID=CAMNT_0016323039 /DNA_START=87 /DNA_END=623 /DNA_ORIENTATION=+